MLDDEVRADDLLERIIDGAVRRDVPAGGTVHEPADGPIADLLLSGLLRMYMRRRFRQRSR